MVRRSRKTAAAVAQDTAAPEAERYDAAAEVTKSALAQQLLPKSELQPVLDYISDQMFESDMMKGRGITLSPTRGPEHGMRSVYVDDFQVSSQGDYYDRPGLLNFDSMRAMVEQTPILNAILLTRQRQIMRFCRPQQDPSKPGFVISHIDEHADLSDEHKKSIELLRNFVMNCGWEDDPRRRKILKRDTFPQFMAKRIRDSLTMDAAPIETEFKRNRNLGLDGVYAVDGGSIRLCTEMGYNGDDEIFALQVLSGQIKTAYTHYDLTYEVRNPRSDVLACGYGFSETEMLIRVVTYLLNTMTYNSSFFEKNAIPRGMLQLVGNYDPADLAAFKRLWLAMCRGIQNVHNLPVMVSKDTESKATFTEIGGQLTEMAFGRWMSFLTSLACAVYGIAPEEVSMESYSAGRSPLSGSDTEEKLTNSSDKGLEPLLAHFECEYSDYIIRPFSPQYRLQFKGLDADDAQKRFEMRKLVLTLDEGREGEGWDKVGGDIGGVPLNPALQNVWLALRQEKMAAQQEDFGNPEDGDRGELIGGPPAAGGNEEKDAPERRDAKPGEAKPAAGPEFSKAIDPARFGLRPIYVIGGNV